MAIKTTWRVRHRCGHRIAWDLSDKSPSERSGFATWLSQRDCTRCWWARRRSPDRRTRVASRPKRKTQQVSAIESWETDPALPALVGSEKAVGWARQIRHRLLRSAHRHLVSKGPGSEHELIVLCEKPASQFVDAAWWIDHRHADPEDLLRLFSGLETPRDRQEGGR
jgi:hypothetical protein